MTEINLRIDGMSCGHCVAAVRSALEGVPEARVEEVAIGRARVMVPRPELAAELQRAVEASGYRAIVA